MRGFVLGGAEPTHLLSHLALYGLAAIAADQGADRVRVSWTGGMAPRPVLTLADWDADRVAAAVLDHAVAHAAADSWIQRDVPGSRGRGLMSPRLSVMKQDSEWRAFQAERWEVLDDLVGTRKLLDQRLIHALGEPAYWRFNPKGERLQDDGASRLEMTPRNQGSELVGTRLRKLAATVAARTVSQVRDGLVGITPVDEAAGKDVHVSRSGNGLAPTVGQVDNALAWCAQWGISQMPLALKATDVATTTGHLGASTSGVFFAPTWRSPWTMGRLRTVLASAQLRDVARTAAGGSGRKTKTAEQDDAAHAGPLADSAARAWLYNRGILAIVTFEVRRFGSDSAPERRAQRGRLERLAER